MERNLLEGWLALAAETRRIDRLSSSLGLDSPAFQNSPSSLGSSRGSSGLNTPSQNAFRFLPFLNDISPELLKTTSFDFGRASLPLSRERSPQSQPHRNGNPPQIQTRRQAARQRASSDAVNAPISDWKSPKLSRAHPYPYHNTPGHLVGGTPSSVGHSQRPSLHSNRLMSYPAWPASKPVIPLSTDFNLDRPSSIYGAPISPPGPSRIVTPRYTDGHGASEFEYGPAINDSISPLLSEPFHRLIVKDEEESTELSSMRSSSRVNFDGEMDTVPEEEDQELPETWWNDDSRDMPFEFEIAHDYQSSLQAPLEKPWMPPRRGFHAV